MRTAEQIRNISGVLANRIGGVVSLLSDEQLEEYADDLEASFESVVCEWHIRIRFLENRTTSFEKIAREPNIIKASRSSIKRRLERLIRDYPNIDSARATEARYQKDHIVIERKDVEE